VGERSLWRRIAVAAMIGVLELAPLETSLAAPIVDPAAPIRFRPTITHTTGTANPVPVVNITAPNAAGASLNRYRNFDVDAAGLILNNSRVGGGSLIGGNVAANPNLGARSANLIVNEVTATGGAFASHLNGSLEVFGDSAAIVIANPNGIACKDCSFINAPGVTLTTGIPQFLNMPGGEPTSFDNATALAFDVQSGHVQIGDGSPGTVGIDGTVGRINVIAQTIGVDAPVYAGGEANLIAGRQWVLQTEPGTGAHGSDYLLIPDTAAGVAQHGVAIDATAFGALTAGQIKIIANENGLGVRTDGALAASAADLTISADGDVHVGRMYANRDVAVDAAGQLDATGDVVAQSDLTLDAKNGLVTGGKLTAERDLVLASNGDIEGSGDLAAKRNLTFDADGTVNESGAITSGGELMIAAQQDVALTGTTSAADIADLHINGDLALGNVETPGGFNAAATGSITVGGELETGASLALAGGRDVSLGKVTAVGGAAVTSEHGQLQFDGDVLAGGDVTASADTTLTATGDISSLGNLNLDADHGDIVSGGHIAASKDVTITAAGDVRLQQGASAEQNMSLAGTAVSNLGTLNTGQNLVITASGDLAGGHIAASDNARLSGTDVALADTQIGGDLAVDARKSLANSGSLAVKGKVTLDADGDFVNAGQISSGASLSVDAPTIINQAGAGLTALDSASFDAQNIHNAGSIYGKTVNLTAAAALDNDNGSLLAQDDLSVTAAALAGNRGGTIASENDAIVVLRGAGAPLDNNGGQILAAHNLTLSLPQAIFDASDGNIGTLNPGGNLTIDARAFNNSGEWQAPGNALTLDLTQAFTNSGVLKQSGNLMITTSGDIINNGKIVSDADVTLTAAQIINRDLVHADGKLALGGSIGNSGTLEAAGDVSVQGSTFDNASGTTQAGGDLDVDITGALDNIAGLLQAGRDIDLRAAQISNDRAAPVTTVITAKAVDDLLLLSTVIGTRDLHYSPDCDSDGTCDPDWDKIGAGTLADLSPNLAQHIADFYQTYESLTDSEGYPAGGMLVWNAGDPPIYAPGEPHQPVTATHTLMLPTVDRTVVRQSHGDAGRIVSGRNLSIAAGSVSNRGGIVAAGGNISVTAGSLDNGRSATLTQSITDRVNQTELDAFIDELNHLDQYTPADWRHFLTATDSGISLNPSAYADPDCSWCDVPVTATLNPAETAAAPSIATQTQQLGVRGQILSGGNIVLTVPNWINTGTVIAANNLDLDISGAFVNQGDFTYSKQTVFPEGTGHGGLDVNGDNFDPYYQLLDVNLDPAVIAAGNTLTINAGSIANRYGQLLAGGSVSVTTPGTLTNLAGTIEARNGDVILNAGAVSNTRGELTTLDSRVPDGGSTEDFYRITKQADTTPAATILGARDVQITASSLDNVSSIISAGRDLSVNATAAVNNTARTLELMSQLSHVEACGMFGDSHCREWDPMNYGQTESSPAIMQAGGTLHVAGVSGHFAALVNTGTIAAYTVGLVGSSITNGFTDYHTQTPPAIVPEQVIPLASPELPGSMETAQGQAFDASTLNVSGPTENNDDIDSSGFAPSAVDTGDYGQSGALPPGLMPAGDTDIRYVDTSPAGTVLNTLGPDVLLADLPPELRPDTQTFYADPYTEDQLLRQAALKETGHAYFVNGLAWDDQNRASVDDQQKAILYANAVQFAKLHDVPLGEALTPEQVATLDQPLLWYVEQQVSDGQGGTLPVLMPTIYLPQVNQKSLSALSGGVIQGRNVSLTAIGDGTESNPEGTITNTGFISARDLLIQAKALQNEKRNADVGLVTERPSSEGYWKITGDAVQPGGFISAANYQLSVQAIDSVSGELAVLDQQGEVDQQKSVTLLANLKARLGADFSSSETTDHLQRHWVQTKSHNATQLAMIAVDIGVFIATQGMGAAALGLQAGSTEATIANAAFSATVADITTQAAFTGRIDPRQVLLSGLTAVASAGVGAAFGSEFNIGRFLSETAMGCASAEIMGGDCSSGAKFAAAMSLLSWAGHAMRENQLQSSDEFKGVCNAHHDCFNNRSGSSGGVDGDRRQVAGTRISWDDLNKYGVLTDNKDGTWEYTPRSDVINPLTGRSFTLQEALAQQGGLTGGTQALPGTLVGISYRKGSFWDKLLESYAGPHDWLDSWSMYDELGNNEKGRSEFENVIGEGLTAVNLVPATAFALPTLLRQYGINSPVVLWERLQADTKREQKR
jgi:filamentous hemagglutinin